MKRFAATLIALFVVTSASAFAQSNASANASSEAKIVAGISLSKVDDLKFGQVIRSAQAGSVSMDATSGARSASGGVTLGLVDGARPAEFSVSGEAQYNFAVTLPSSITITKIGSTETMTVSNLASTLTNNAGTLDASGNASFKVGGDLSVAANQATGTYQGDFSVTAAYN